MLVALLLFIYIGVGVAAINEEDDQDNDRRMMISLDRDFDSEDPIVIRELRRRMTYSDNRESYNVGSTYLPAAVRLMKAFGQNAALFNESSGTPTAMRRFFTDILDPDLNEARANIIAQMNIADNLRRNPSLWNEDINIHEEIHNLIIKKQDSTPLHNADTIPSSMRKALRQKDNASNVYDPMRSGRRYGSTYPFKWPSVKHDVSGTTNKTYVNMRQIIYRTMERLNAGQSIMKRYAQDPRMRIGYLLKRLDQWTIQMHVMYSEITRPRTSKKHWDWGGYLKDAIYYAHYFRKYIDVIYGVELLLHIHNTIFKEIEEMTGSH